MAERTIFQTIEDDLSDWEATGRRDKPPARVAFRSLLHGVSAYVDPYRKLPGTVVITPHEGTPGKPALLHTLPPSRLMTVELVAQAVAQNMEGATGLRPIEHVEGYGVPDHAHTVLFPAARGEGKALYEQAEQPDPETLEAELDTTLDLYQVKDERLTVLMRRLEIVRNIAPLLDSAMPPIGVEMGLQSLVDRVTLTT